MPGGSSQGTVKPYEVFYLGECGRLGESFVSLSEGFYLPTDYFAPKLLDWADHSEAIKGDRYLTPSRNAERVGRLSVRQLEMSHLKQSSFWTRRADRDLAESFGDAQ